MQHPHPLLNHIGRLRRRVRWLLVLFAAAWVVGLSLAVAVVLGALDYWIHIEDRGLRILCSLALVAALGWTVWRFLARSIFVRLNDQQLAARVEQRFPQLNDRLTSTLDFLNQAEDDATAGSAALRKAVIAETVAAVDAMNVRDAVDSRPTRRAMLAAAVVMALVGLLMILDASSVRIAAQRLVNPLSKQAWPKRYHLAFKKVFNRAPVGGVFEVEVVDSRGQRLPDDVKLHLRYDGAKDQAENMRFHNGAMVYRLESLSRPFSYKATGGDDNSMEWTRLEIVEPPAIQSLAVKLHPPAYTGWPVATSDRHLRAIRDTKVEFHGTATKRLKSAVLRLDDGTEFPAVLSNDRFDFSLPLTTTPFVVRKSGSYTFQLVDDENFPNNAERAYEIRCAIDLAPNVIVEQPSGDIYVTAQAEVPLKIVAKDDLAVRDVELRYSRSDESQKGEVAEVLYKGPGTAPEQPSGVNSEGESRTIEHRWNVADLKLPPGAQVTFFAAASDYLPQNGQSTARRLIVITPDELHDRLAERQTLILGEIARALQAELDSRSQVGEVQKQFRKVGELRKDELDRLQGAELSQRQVNRLLTSDEDGVPSQIRQLLSELENNKVDSPEIGRRMQGLLDLLGELERDHLGTITAELTRALKEAQSGMDRRPQQGQKEPGQPQSANENNENKSSKNGSAENKTTAPSEKEPPEVGTTNKTPEDKRPAEAGTTNKPPKGGTTNKPAEGAVNTAAEHQDAVIAALENLKNDLKGWDDYRQFFRDVNDVRKEHDNIVQETKRTGQSTLTKDFSKLTPQQQADLAKLADRQREMGRQMDLIQQRMDEMARQLGEKDPQAAGVLNDALHQARSQGLSGQMRQAADQVGKNQLSQAGQSQQKVGDGLRDLLDTLANRRENELARLVKKLREAEQDLNNIREQQQRLRKAMAEAEKNPDEEARKRELMRLAREQQQLQQQAQRLARQLQRLQAERSGNKMAGASQKMGQSGQQAEQGNAGGAQDAAQQAEKDLENAQQQLAQERQQAELDLAMEELARLEDALRGLSGQQQTVITETQRLDEIRTTEGRLTRGQLLSLRDLARQELQIREETQSMAEKLEPAQVFNRALQNASKALQLAAEMLDQQQTGDQAQRPAQRAWRQFQNLIAALQPEKDDGMQNGGNEQENGGNSGGGQNSGQPPGDGVTTVAQLKMLKLMQEDVKERTRELQEAIGNAPELTAEQQQQLAELTAEQGELARLLINLSQPTAKPKEDDPEKLPDLPLEDSN